MKIKIGINGMGRIGRMIIRSIFENNHKNIEIKHINNRTNSEVTSALLKYDSIHGKFDAEVKFDDRHLIINKKNLKKVKNIFPKKFKPYPIGRIIDYKSKKIVFDGKIKF